MFLDAGDDRLIDLFDAGSTPPGGASQPLDPAHRPTDAERGRVAALVHFAIRTDDAPALFERALAAGARPFAEPMKITTDAPYPMSFQAAFVYGPNDEVIEFIDRETGEGSRRGQLAMNGGEREHPVLAMVTSTGAALRFFDGLTYDPLGDLPVLPSRTRSPSTRGRRPVRLAHLPLRGLHRPGREGPRNSWGWCRSAPEVAPHGLALDQDRGLLYVTVECT